MKISTLAIPFTTLAVAFAMYTIGYKQGRKEIEPQVQYAEKKLAACQAQFSHSAYMQAVQINLSYHSWFAKHGLDPEAEGVYQPPSVIIGVKK